MIKSKRLNSVANIGPAFAGSFAGLREATAIPSLETFSLLSLEVGNDCPLECKHCAYKAEKPENRIPNKYVHQSVVEAIRQGYKPTWVSLSGKEPTMFPDDLCQIAESIYGHTDHMILMTNGLLLTDSLIERLTPFINCFDLSLDGDEAAHEWMRGAGKYVQTKQSIDRIISCGGEQVGIISTAVNAELPDGRKQYESIISLGRELSSSYGYGNNISLSVSLYYGQPHDSLLLDSVSIIELARGLSSLNLKSYIVVVSNYAHKWQEITQGLGINDIRLEYDSKTGIPILRYGNVNFVLFNMAENELHTLRISNSGRVYLGCNHLSWDDAKSSKYSLGDLASERFEDIITRFNNADNFICKELLNIPSKCSQCSNWHSCKGGDRVTGLYSIGIPRDLYCPHLNS